MNGITNKTQQILQHEWSVIPVTLLAIGLRIYRLSAQPLWLDEIYTMQLVQEGPLAILRNSQLDQTPSGFYLLQWLATGFGSVGSEWGWRWLSVCSGCLAIPLLYMLCRRFTGRMAASLAALTLAVSPFHIYYSQEGRTYAFLVLLALVATLTIAKILENPKPGRGWFAIALLSLVGQACSVFYLLINAVQGLVLFLGARRRTWWLYAGCIVGISALTAWVMMPPLISSANREIYFFLSPLSALQALAGETARLTIGWHHWMLAGVIGILAAVGIFYALVHIKKYSLAAYLGLQLLLAGVFIFVVLPLVGVRLPTYQSRQLLMLLPALLGLMALGLDLIQRRFGWRYPAFLCGVILLASGVGINAFWQYDKSPEGTLAQRIGTELQTDDVVVSLHYSTTAGVYAYLPQADAWVYRGEKDGEHQFDQELRLYQVALLRPRPTNKTTLAVLHNYDRVWVLGREIADLELVTALMNQCTLVKQEIVKPFEAWLWERCR